MDHPIPVTFIRLIILLPLIGATINFLAGAWLQKTFGKRAISLVGCGVVILAFLLAVRAFHGMIGLPPENRFMLDDLWKWFDVGGLNLDIAFWLDPLSMIMTLIITGVGGLIHIYSTGYMHDDDGYWRFLRMAQPVHLRDAGAGAGRQHVADVRRLGRRGAVLVRADRLLVQGAGEHDGRQQGVHREPRRRPGIRDRAVQLVRRPAVRSGIRRW